MGAVLCSINTGIKRGGVWFYFSLLIVGIEKNRDTGGTNVGDWLRIVRNRSFHPVIDINLYLPAEIHLSPQN